MVPGLTQKNLDVESPRDLFLVQICLLYIHSHLQI